MDKEKLHYYSPSVASGEIKNLPMVREVDTNSYLPQVIGDAEEIININKTVDPELRLLWVLFNKVFYNRFISTADSDGLARYEKLIGIPTDLSKDIEARRKVVHYEWNKNVIYTNRSVRQRLDGLIGNDGYTMDIIYEEYVVEFAIVIRDEMVDPNYVYKELREIIPANMGIRFTIVSAWQLQMDTYFDDFIFRYHFTGQHYTGTIYDYASKGIAFNTDINLNHNLDRRNYSYRMPEQEHTVSEHRVYALENQKQNEEPTIIDCDTAVRLANAPILEGGRKY